MTKLNIQQILTIITPTYQAQSVFYHNDLLCLDIFSVQKKTKYYTSQDDFSHGDV